MAEIVTVVIDGFALQGWQSIGVNWGAEAAAIAFSLAAANPAWSQAAQALRRGKLLEVYCAPDTDATLGQFEQAKATLLCTGYVDDYGVESTPASRKVGISGRSKAGDAIDCPPVKHKTGLEENKTLLEVARRFDEWGINFTSDLKLPKIPEFQVVPGQPLFVALEREARYHGALLMGQPDGGVAITRAGKKRHAGALVHGQAPAEDWKLNLSIQNKRSEIHVRGQRTLGATKKELRQNEVAKDGSVGRHRPYILWNEGDQTSEELRRRGEWERLRRSGSGIALTVKVSTWRDEAGQIWTPGYLLAVVWDEEGIDQDLCIKSVALDQSEADGEGGGTHAVLTLVDPKTLGAEDGGSGSGSGAGNGGGTKGGAFSNDLDGPGLSGDFSGGASSAGTSNDL